MMKINNYILIKKSKKLVSLMIVGLCLVAYVQAQKRGVYIPGYQLSGSSALTTSQGQAIASQASDIYYFTLAPNSVGNLCRISGTTLKPVFNSSLQFNSDGLIEKSNIDKIKSWGGSARIHITVGGDFGSKLMNTMAANTTYRERFAKQVVKFAQLNNLYGIDIDWEQSGGPVDFPNYQKFIAAIRSQSAKPVTVTINPTLYANYSYISQASYIQLMTYIGAPTSCSGTLQLWCQSKITSYLNSWTNKGCPKSKLLVGIPALAKPASGTTISYNSLGALAYSWDSKTVNGTTYYFNGVNTVKAKTKYTKDNGYSGVFLWSAGQDRHDSYSLLKAMYDQAVSSSKLSGSKGQQLEQGEDLTERYAKFSGNIYPNPIDNNVFNLELALTNPMNASAVIYNLDGRVVWRKQDFSQEGFQKIEIDPSNWSSGIYLFRLTEGENKVTKKIIKK